MDYNKAEIENKCKLMKFKALEMALGAGAFGAHIGGGFSSMEILATLYEFAKINAGDENRDRIILSKGHGVLALYTALWQKGFITEEELKTFDQNGTKFHGHPNRNINKALEFSAGSLGLGLSYAVGVALACKQKNLSNHIYVIVGDGECDEGIIWESIMSISNFNLNNMTIIVDRNKYQLDGPTAEVMDNSPLEKKFEAFGFDVCSVNGHEIEELMNAYKSNSDKPKVIIADTIKANGIKFLENNKISHQTALSAKKYEQAVNDIKAYYGDIND